MVSIQNTSNVYTLKNVYSLKKNTLSKIISNLKGNADDSILFPFIDSYNQNEFTDKDFEDIDSLLEGYFEGYLYFKNVSTKKQIENEVKELLIKTGNYEKLYEALITNPYSLEKNVLAKIGKIVFFNTLAETKNSYPDFVKGNVLYKNNYILDSVNFSCELKEDLRLNILWYKANSSEDIFNCIREDNYFKGILVENNCGIENFYCGFKMIETASNNDIVICYKKCFENVPTIVQSINKLLEA